MFIWIIAANSTAGKHYPTEYKKKKKLPILKMIVRLFQVAKLQQRITHTHTHTDSSIVACYSQGFFLFVCGGVFSAIIQELLISKPEDGGKNLAYWD